MLFSSLITILSILIACLSDNISRTTTIPLPPVECSWPCPFEVKAICATNGKKYQRFNSECLLKAYNCETNSTYQQVDHTLCDKKLVHTIEACNRRCDEEELSPICASDGETHKLFRNNCEKVRQECESGFKWQNIGLEACRVKKPCETHCSPLSRRACGYDGETYRSFLNSCFLQASNCRNEGKKWKEVPICRCDDLQAVLKFRCDFNCPTLYDPVCGIDGNDKKKTFDNVCELIVHNCMSCINFTIINTDACSEP